MAKKLTDDKLGESSCSIGRTLRVAGRGHKPQGIVSKVAKQSGLSPKTVRRALYQPDPAKVDADNAKKAHDDEPLTRVRRRDAFLEVERRYNGACRRGAGAKQD